MIMGGYEVGSCFERLFGLAISFLASIFVYSAKDPHNWVREVTKEYYI